VIKFIGLTGLNCSGKGVASEVLIEKGYSYFSLSDEVREEAARRGLDPGRDNLTAIGNDLREKEGPGTLAKRILPRLSAPAVIDSIRNPEEINVLRDTGDFVLIAVTAPAEIRFRRMLERGRGGDAATFETFLEHEEREKSGSASRQQLHTCLEMADITIENGNGLEEFRNKLLEACNIEKGA
jgi:dephospho-CoA kinase